jgi:hypothetical protein
MFGFKFISDRGLKELKEENTIYRRTLDDLGWTNLSMDPASQNVTIGMDFKEMIRRCKIYYYRNPLAGLWVNLTTEFVFGEGVSEPKAEDEKVQEIITKFWNDPDNQVSMTSYQAQTMISNKLQYEGNIFFMIFTDDVADVRVRIINTEEVDDIIKDQEDRMRPMWYKLKTSDRKFNFQSDAYEMSMAKIKYCPDWNNLKPEEAVVPTDKFMKDAVIFHVKINCDINDKFGIPELFRGIDWIKANKEASEDLATLVRSLSTLAWKKKIKGTPTQVNNLKAAMQAKTDFTNIGPGAGSTQYENQGIETTPIDIKTGGASVNEVSIRQSKLMVCAASGIFEHYYGDPSTGNMATATTMELPMIKKFKGYQKLWTDIFDAIILYQIMKKIEVGVLPGGHVDYDEKTRRNIIFTEFDRSVDTDFPDIISKDPKVVAEALEIAKRNNLIGDETAARIFLLAVNQNNIEDEIAKIDFTRVSVPAGFAPGQPGPGSVQPKAGVVKEDANLTKEVKIEEDVTLPDRKKAMRFAKKSNYVLQRMNGYKKVLLGHYKTMQKDIQKSIDARGEPGKVVGMIKDMTAHVTKFAQGMNSAAIEYFPIAIEIGSKYMQAHVDEAKIRESIYEAGNRSSSLLIDRLAWNKGFIDNSLAPDIESTLISRMRTTYNTAEDFYIAVNASIESFESRVGTYAGAFWTVEEQAVKEAGKGTGLEANFAGADDNHTCVGCEEAMAGNPWPIDEIPEPGSHECTGNCRHAIQII